MSKRTFELLVGSANELLNGGHLDAASYCLKALMTHPDFGSDEKQCGRFLELEAQIDFKQPESVI